MLWMRESFVRKQSDQTFWLTEDVCIVISRLVQAARQLHKKAVEILCNIGLKGGDVDQFFLWMQE